MVLGYEKLDVYCRGYSVKQGFEEYEYTGFDPHNSALAFLALPRQISHNYDVVLKNDPNLNNWLEFSLKHWYSIAYESKLLYKYRPISLYYLQAAYPLSRA